MAEPEPTFELRARLGAGGMGEVHLALMRRGGTEKLVALKRMRADTGAPSELYPQFQREARICAMLEHPNVVHLEAWGIDAVGPYLALELVDGRSASALLHELARLKQQMPLEVALCIARDAARGLAYASGLSVVHRDISPDNVLITYDGLSKVTDFGVAKVEGASTLTTTGKIAGKYGYLAPELFEGQRADTRSDIFAFAATLYRLVTGVPAFVGRTEAELLRAVMSSEPVRPSLLREVPAVLDEWIVSGLQKNPALRPATFGEVLSFLEAPLVDAPDEGRAAVRACMLEAWPPGPDQRRTELSLPAISLPSTVARKKARPRSLAGVAWIAGGVAAAALILTLAVQRSGALAPEPEPVNAVDAGQQPQPPALVDAGTRPEPVDAAGEATVVTVADAGHRAPVKPQVRKPPGKLVVRSFKYVRVYVDGQLRGETPMKEGVELAAGRHVVKAVNEKLKFEQTYDVTIPPGGVETLKVVVPESEGVGPP